MIIKKADLIMSKDYARLIRIIHGERRIIPEEMEAYNNNPELAEIVDEMLLESWDPYDLEYLAINDFILEGKDHNDFVSYIKENAEDIAKHFEAMHSEDCATPNKVEEFVLFYFLAKKINHNFFQTKTLCKKQRALLCTKFGARKMLK